GLALLTQRHRRERRKRTFPTRYWLERSGDWPNPPLCKHPSKHSPYYPLNHAWQASFYLLTVRKKGAMMQGRSPSCARRHSEVTGTRATSSVWLSPADEVWHAMILRPPLCSERPARRGQRPRSPTSASCWQRSGRIKARPPKHAEFSRLRPKLALL